MELDGDITVIGRVMDSLPIDPKLTKLILYGYCVSVSNACVIIGKEYREILFENDSNNFIQFLAAALSCTETIFKFDKDDGVRAYERRLKWANGSGSDLIAMLNAYNSWAHMHKTKAFGMGTTKAERKRIDENEKKWADEHSLEMRALCECDAYMGDLHSRLKRLELKALDHKKFKWTNTVEESIILKVVIYGAFYPNYFLRGPPIRPQDERAMFKLLDGRDPTKTIYFETDGTELYNRKLYVETIKDMFIGCGVVDDKSKMKVIVGSDKQTVYVTFEPDDTNKEYNVTWQPRFALAEVYKAIQMRKLTGHPKIRVLR